MARALLAPLVLLLLFVISSAAFVVREDQQMIITQFGKPVGDAITEPGLHFKVPFIQKLQVFDRRFLEWQGDAEELPTRDKVFIFVDVYARWRISDPLLFFVRLRDERGGQSRLDDILDGETRNTIAKHDLIEVIRSSNRTPAVSESDLFATQGAIRANQAAADAADAAAAQQAEDRETGDGEEGAAPAPVLSADLGPSSDLVTGSDELEPIEVGREEIRRQILEAAQRRTAGLGIEILDIQFRRINYGKQVEEDVFQRMISERKRIADRYRSQGRGEQARILGEMDRDLKRISSEAYREAETIRGRADAEAADIYARAYDQSVSARNFYEFLKTMESLENTVDKETMLLLSTDGEFYSFLEGGR